jgi:hypothetical protein
MSGPTPEDDTAIPPAPTIDWPLVGVVAAVALALAAWGAAIPVDIRDANKPSASHLPVELVVVAVGATAACLYLATAYARRRRERATAAMLRSVAATCHEETLARLRDAAEATAVTNRLMATALERIDQTRIEVTVQHEAIGRLGEAVEGLGPKIEAAAWRAYTEGFDDARGGAPGAVRTLRPQAN